MRKATIRPKSPALKTSRSKQPAPEVTEILDILTRDPEGRTPLHLAAWYGYGTVVRRMIAQEADLNARDELGRTPGHWASFRGYLDVIKQLIAAGSDINARDTHGRTWLSMAIIGKQQATEAYLRANGGVG